ncbi:RraA family protein [Rhodoligotrophos defluvii]|uniref:RraA family protein n=1 Tax=Rhodoligotrophos defluvii TaxID=2561934 RepID=UPI001960596E|nr:dimethylmenaquinone methyltransferase [Rhodoligotrophos defluvii]
MDLAAVLQLGTATLLEASKLQAWLGPDIRAMWAGAQLAGPAYPVRCASGDNLAIHLAMDRTPKGAVLVIDGAGATCGYWGEILTAMAQQREVAGVVVNGGVRDTAALEQLRFPVFARGVGLSGTTKGYAGEPGASVFIGGVSIQEGDLVVGDRDGVICLPRTHISSILEKAKMRRAREEIFLAEIREGKSTLELLGLK